MKSGDKNTRANTGRILPCSVRACLPYTTVAASCSITRPCYTARARWYVALTWTGTMATAMCVGGGSGLSIITALFVCRGDDQKVGGGGARVVRTSCELPL